MALPAINLSTDNPIAAAADGTKGIVIEGRLKISSLPLEDNMALSVTPEDDRSTAGLERPLFCASSLAVRREVTTVVVLFRVGSSTLDSVECDCCSIWVVVSGGSTTMVSVAGGSVVVDEKWSAIFLSALVVFVRVCGLPPDSVVGDSSSIWVLISSG